VQSNNVQSWILNYQEYSSSALSTLRIQHISLIGKCCMCSVDRHLSRYA